MDKNTVYFNEGVTRTVNSEMAKQGAVTYMKQVELKAVG